VKKPDIIGLLNWSYPTTQGESKMLVLSRKLGEKIVIDGNIFVTIVDVERGKVRLGIDAPRDVQVDRQEIHEARQANQPAAQAV